MKHVCFYNEQCNISIHPWKIHGFTPICYIVKLIIEQKNYYRTLCSVEPNDASGKSKIKINLGYFWI